MELHPSLAELVDKVNGLLTDFHEGHITLQEAMELWSSMIAIDGEHNRWSVDQNSTPGHFEFIRTSPDGTVSEKTDPAFFAPAKLPPNPAFPFGGIPVSPQASPWKPVQPTESFDPWQAAPDPTASEEFQIKKSKPKKQLPSFDFKEAPGAVADFFGAGYDKLNSSHFFRKYKSVLVVTFLCAAVLLYLVFVYSPNQENAAQIGEGCTDLSQTVPGVPEGEIGRLMGCLDSPGPGIAPLLVDSRGNEIVFNGTSAVTNATTAASLGRLHERFQIELPSNPPQPADISTVDPSLVQVATRAVNAGLVDPAFLPAESTTLGELVVSLDKLWMQEAPSRPLPAGEAAPQSNDIDPAAVAAEARMSAAGLTGFDEGEAFNFNQEVTKNQWVQMVGRTYFYLINAAIPLPGNQPETSSDRPTLPTTPATPQASDLPSSDRLDAIEKALVSKDNTSISSVLLGGVDITRDQATIDTYNGYNSIGITLRSGPPTKDGDASVVKLDAYYPPTNAVVASANAKLVLGPTGEWVLETLPVFTNTQ